MNNTPIKPNYKIILSCVIAALLIFSIITNANQANEIEQLNNRINNLTSELNFVRGEISSIYQNVDERMKKQASLLSDLEYEIGALDTNNHTIEVALKVVPKTVTDNMKLSVMVGDTVVEFKQNGIEFSANIPVDMFISDDEHPTLYIDSEIGTQTEVLENVRISYLHDRVLPDLHAQIFSNVDYNNGKAKLNSHLHISAKPAMLGEEITFVKYELVTEVNGEEIEREELTDKVIDGVYRELIQKTIDASIGDNVVIYVLAEDSLGYVHKATALSWYKSESGAVAEDLMVDDYIYDKNGNLLSER